MIYMYVYVYSLKNLLEEKSVTLNKYGILIIPVYYCKLYYCSGTQLYFVSLLLGVEMLLFFETWTFIYDHLCLKQLSQ